MAMASGGGYGGGSYSYTRTYTLEEAIERASQGLLEPDWVYQKLPPPLQGELDRLASHRFSERLLALSRERQRAVMATMVKAIKDQNRGNESKPLSILEALTMARDGVVEPAKLFSALPEDLRNVLDAMAREQGSGAFCDATSRQQVALLDSLLRSINERAQEEAKRHAEEEAKSRAEAEAKRRAEQEAKRRAEEEAKRRAKEEARRRAGEEAKRRAEEEARRRAEQEAKRRAEAEAKRRALITTARRNSKQCILCGLPLGLINRLLRRERHPSCIEWRD